MHKYEREEKDGDKKKLKRKQMYFYPLTSSRDAARSHLAQNLSARSHLAHDLNTKFHPLFECKISPG